MDDIVNINFGDSWDHFTGEATVARLATHGSCARHRFRLYDYESGVQPVCMSISRRGQSPSLLRLRAYCQWELGKSSGVPSAFVVSAPAAARTHNPVTSFTSQVLLLFIKEYRPEKCVTIGLLDIDRIVVSYVRPGARKRELGTAHYRRDRGFTLSELDCGRSPPLASLPKHKGSPHGSQ